MGWQEKFWLKVQKERRSKELQNFHDAMRDISEAFATGWQEGMNRFNQALQQAGGVLEKMKPVIATSEFVEAERKRRYANRIEMERQLGLKFIRDLADEKRDELGLPRVHHI